jgi:hypothetical protein
VLPELVPQGRVLARQTDRPRPGREQVLVPREQEQLEQALPEQVLPEARSLQDQLQRDRKTEQVLPESELGQEPERPGQAWPARRMDQPRQVLEREL